MRGGPGGELARVQEGNAMTFDLRCLAMTGSLVCGVAAAGTPTLAQNPGGILRVDALNSPPSMSMHEEVDAVPARANGGGVQQTSSCSTST
jgi:hypothetical protein